ncbi:MAG TPA: 16S rRNA (guanine(527)-N(7))-methyltransferase RsmG [Dissulfurispiraceae bacterium]|nr:16S rRNA (guanine(527)-N(7))-methyltransferase RsmG [Dissulfurispiraceae bacterium]
MEKERQILKEGLDELGIDPTAEVLDQFDIYLRELKKWNKAYNLTAITDDRDIVIKHFLDSLLYLKAIPEGPLTLCDVGTGGGFPGIPIAIVRPDLLITLLEPSRKKIAFLRQLRRLLSLQNIEILGFRAEELVDSQFDVIVTRATFSISNLLTKAGHVMKAGGVFILNKGPKFEEEVGKLPGSVHYEVIRVSLVKTQLTRNLIRVSSPATQVPEKLTFS